MEHPKRLCVGPVSIGHLAHRRIRDALWSCEYGGDGCPFVECRGGNGSVQFAGWRLGFDRWRELRLGGRFFRFDNDAPVGRVRWRQFGDDGLWSGRYILRHPAALDIRLCLDLPAGGHVSGAFGPTTGPDRLATIGHGFVPAGNDLRRRFQ